MGSISPARRAALEILLELERGRAHSDDLLRDARVERLTIPDRNLTTALVLGVLRWQIRLDQLIREFLDHPNARLDPEIQIALRLGAFQLLNMDRIPAHAAIGESVELAKQAGHRFAARMVNAVLRKLAGAPVSKDAATESAAVQAFPKWMVERWNRFYGSAAVQAICIHGQTQPATGIRVESVSVEDEFAKAGIQMEPGRLLGAARIVTAGDVTATAAFREGRLRLQDEGSQLVAEIAGGPPNQGRNCVLDACAAPGGKMLILAERNPQARIVAVEVSAQRLAELQKRLVRFGDRIECRLADAAALTEESVYDLALADVPCSGTGTLGRNPEIRHRLRLEDLPRQAERQRAILRAALRATKPGGRVVYSTCSLELEENEQVIAMVLAEATDARAVSAGERIAQMCAEGILTAQSADRLQGCVTPEGYLRLLPGALGTDGFFIAVIERESRSEPAFYSLGSRSFS
jgi:16S rRNA (cytosine967-C5)-methyltransferase